VRLGVVLVLLATIACFPAWADVESTANLDGRSATSSQIQFVGTFRF